MSTKKPSSRPDERREGLVFVLPHEADAVGRSLRLGQQRKHVVVGTALCKPDRQKIDSANRKPDIDDKHQLTHAKPDSDTPTGNKNDQTDLLNDLPTNKE